MATTNPIGVIQVAHGNIKVIGVDGVVRIPAFGDFIYEGEKIVSDDPSALFQVKYTALQEASAYDGPFSILADGSAISAADATDNALTEAEQLAILEGDEATAAGEEGPVGDSAFIPSGASAQSSVQGFSRGGDTEQGTGRSFANEAYEGDFNDQPEIEDLVIGGFLESRGDQNDKDDVDTEMGGALNAQDEDPFDNHIFYVQSMTLPETQEPQSEGRGHHHHHVTPTESLDQVDYFHSGATGASSIIKVLVESDDIDPNKIDVKELVLTDNDGKDSRTGFTLTGDFNALADGEEATVTFQYFADDLQGFGDNDQPHETSISEMRTVEMTITGTNDRPVVHNIELGEKETYDSRYWKDSYPKDGNPTNDEGDNVLGGILSGWVHAHDDDVNNNHIFGLEHMTLPTQGDDVELVGGKELIKGVQYDTNGLFTAGGTGTVDVLFESSTPLINAGDISLGKIVFWSNHGGDSKAFFTLDGDFSALGAGERATITFKYYADDQRGFGDAGDENNEASISEVKTVTMTVCGTNDQPFVQDVSEIFAETTSTGGALDYDQTDVLTTFGVETLAFLPAVQDDDKNDNHTYHQQGSASVTGDLSSVPNLSVIVNANGTYSMAGNFNALAVGQSATVSFDYYALDDSGTNQSPNRPHESSKSEVKTVTLTVTGTNDAPEIEESDTNGLTFAGLNGEYYGVNTQIDNLAEFKGIVNANDPAATFRSTVVDYGETGETTWPNLTDGKHVATNESLQAFLKGDAHTLSADPSFTTDGGVNMTDGGVHLSGQVELAAGDYTFRVNSDDGFDIMIDGVSVATFAGNTPPQTDTYSFSLDHGGLHDIEMYWWDQGIEYIFQVELKADGDDGYRTFSSDNFNFSAEAAASVLEAGTTDSGAIVNGIASVSGEMFASDEDQGHVLTWSAPSTDTTYGTFVIDPVSGVWTYTLDNSLVATQALHEDQHVTQSFDVVVTDEHGASDTTPVTIIIQGTNDAPTMTIYGSENLVVNGSFELPDITQGTWVHLASANVPGWTALDEVELWDHLGSYNYPASDGQQHAELDFDGAADTLSQDLDLRAGRYVLTFDAATRDAATKDNAFIVMWNGTQVADITESDLPGSDGTWKTFTFEVEALAGTNTLTFAEESSDNYGPLLDNIGLVAAGTFNETRTGVVANMVADDVDNDVSGVLTYSLLDDHGYFNVTSDGTIILKSGMSLDYENASSYTLQVRVTDERDAYVDKTVNIDVNNVTGVITQDEVEGSIILVGPQTFTDSYEGWTVDPAILIPGDGDPDNANHLGWFRPVGEEQATVSQVFDLTGHEGETVTISFDLKLQGGWDPADEANSDTYTLGITANGVTTDQSVLYTDFSNGTHEIDETAVVGDDGMLTIELSADVTWSGEKWSIDDFEITSSDYGDTTLTFENPSDGLINMEALIDQDNDFGGNSPTSIDEIDLSAGDYVLENITLQDVLDITDGDNVLKITGEYGDGANIAANGWVADAAPTVTETGYDTYTQTGSDVQLLIDVEIAVDVV